MLIDNINLLPADYETINDLTITSNRPNDVVSVNNVSVSDNGQFSLSAQALGAGDATITVSFTYTDYLSTNTVGEDGTVNTPTATSSKTVSKSFRVHVEAMVTGITINSNNNREECNVGDDLTTYLNNFITVIPENTSDKRIKWSVARGDAIAIDNDGKIMAVKAGTSTLQVSSVANPDVSTFITVLVHNPATDKAKIGRASCRERV